MKECKNSLHTLTSRKAIKGFVVIFICISVISFSLFAHAEQFSGTWVGGSQYVFYIYELNSDYTGRWTIACPTYNSFLVLKGTWKSNGNTFSFTTSESGSAPLVGNLSVSFDKGTKNEYTFNGSTLIHVKTHEKLIKLP